MDRLASISPELSEKLKALSPDAHYHVIIRACEYGMKTVRIEEEIGKRAYKAILDHQLILPDELTNLRNLQQSVDKKYLRLLNDDRPEIEWYHLFRKARMLLALIFAFESNLERSSEVVYEVAAMFDHNEREPFFEQIWECVRRNE